MSNFTFVENDSGIQIQVTCSDRAGNLIDLTGSSVLLRWKGSEDETVSERPMDIKGSPTLGQVTYVFQTGELVSPLMDFELQITDSQGGVRTSLESMQERVRERIK